MRQIPWIARFSSEQVVSFVGHQKFGSVGIAEEDCARKILSTLARRAYRRPVTDGDLQTLLSFYKTGRSEGVPIVNPASGLAPCGGRTLSNQISRQNG